MAKLIIEREHDVEREGVAVGPGSASGGDTSLASGAQSTPVEWASGIQEEDLGPEPVLFYAAGKKSTMLELHRDSTVVYGQVAPVTASEARVLWSRVKAWIAACHPTVERPVRKAEVSPGVGWQGGKNGCVRFVTGSHSGGDVEKIQLILYEHGAWGPNVGGGKLGTDYKPDDPETPMAVVTALRRWLEAKPAVT